MNTAFELVQSAFTTATLGWALYFGLGASGLETASVVAGIPALLFSFLAFLGLGGLAIAWIIRHVRITII